MFGLPIWAVDLIIDGLKLIGQMSWAQAFEDKLILNIKARLSNLKTYPGGGLDPDAYPQGRNGGKSP